VLYDATALRWLWEEMEGLIGNDLQISEGLFSLHDSPSGAQPERPSTTILGEGVQPRISRNPLNQIIHRQKSRKHKIESGWLNINHLHPDLDRLRL
tara:strand:- start:105 stop:392 length:288 start_codon:yes stop_codon:yes gene_type:complete